MRILITGGTGLIGSALAQRLYETGHQILILSRKPSRVAPVYDATDNLENVNTDQHIDVIINLAGEPIIDRLWTAKRKQALLDSRVGITRQLYEWVELLDKKPQLLINGSAIGYYGDQTEQVMTEQHSLVLPHDFSHQLCAQWEQEAMRFQALGVRVCIARLGVVVAAKGGMMEGMKLPFKLGLGASIASGKQWMSWVHLNDVVKAMCYWLENVEATGIYNLTAPNPVSNKQFSKALAQHYRRPLLFKAPGFLLRMALGERSQLLLEGQQVIPERLLNEGFEFEYPHLEAAFGTIL